MELYAAELRCRPKLHGGDHRADLMNAPSSWEALPGVLLVRIYKAFARAGNKLQVRLPPGALLGQRSSARHKAATRLSPKACWPADSYPD
ncbi:hypothetical protein WJX82_008887 [Trebouxia sp. C0006]